MYKTFLVLSLALLISWRAEAATTLDGPICELDGSAWLLPEVCATIWYNDVIDDGRVVVCGYDEDAEVLYTGYAGNTDGECEDVYDHPYYYGFFMNLDTSGAGGGSASVVFNSQSLGITNPSHQSGGPCGCSCPIPSDLVSEVGGNTGDWDQYSFNDLIGPNGTGTWQALPGFEIGDGYEPSLFTIDGGASDDKVWQASGALPAINFAGLGGADTLAATWPVVDTYAVGSWPTWFGGGNGANDIDLFTIQPLGVEGTQHPVVFSRWFMTDLGAGPDIFYNGYVVAFTPDTHNPFLNANEFLGNPAATMGAAATDQDLAMSNAANILEEESSGNCGNFSSCVTSRTSCPSWATEGSVIYPTRWYPGEQATGGESDKI